MLLKAEKLGMLETVNTTMQNKEIETKQMKVWQGDFGRDYTDRSTMGDEEFDSFYVGQIGMTRTELNNSFLSGLKIENTLEVGTNIGLQLTNLHNMGYKNLYGIELQGYAVDKSKEITKGKDIHIVKGSGFDVPFKDNSFDLVIASRVLIHISPNEINNILDEIYRCSRKYIFVYEFYEDELKEIDYRGNKELHWKGNYRKLFLERFPDLRLVREEKYPNLAYPGNFDHVFLLEKVESSVKGKKILITGGTGSFGEEATKKFLEDGAKEIVIYSRDEYKQMMMMKKFNDERVSFVIGDVRNREKLEKEMEGVDIVIHAAAMKHIDFCEQNKEEALKTNVEGTRNVVKAALYNEIPVCINLSADKAVYPAGVYGETKAMSEKIFIEGNEKAKALGRKCKFASMRYSNVIGSRGSVVEIFEERLNRGEEISVFNEKMMRLVITQKQVISMMEYAMDKIVGGEILLFESPIMRISDLARAMQSKVGKGSVEIKNEAREGEKYDAVLLGEKESGRTIVSPEGYLVIVPEGENRASYEKKYGEKRFMKGEYGTHNAPYLNQEEIISLLYGGNDGQDYSLSKAVY